MFNKTSINFLLGFLAILALSFVVIFITRAFEGQVEADGLNDQTMTTYERLS